MSLEYIDKKRFLLENYRSVGLNQTQLIILLLCVNNDIVFKLDYDKLNNVMGLTPNEITKELSSLFQGNLLEVTLTKVNNEHVEMIDCSKLFDTKKTKAEANIFSEIEHLFGKSLSSKEVAVISKWISTNKYEYKDIVEAFGIAAINNVKKISYVEKVLENNSTREEKEELVPLTMKYNWLEDE